MLGERKSEIEADYRKAEMAHTEADKMREEYEERLSNVKADAERIVNDAVLSANLRSDAIVKEAEEKADGMIERAEKNIEAQYREAFNDIKNEVGSMAVDIARKIIKRDIDKKDHKELIDKALEGLGVRDE